MGTPVKNKTTQAGIVEFAVGTLNDEVNEQRRVASNKAIKGPSRSCQHLVPLYFRNVRKRNTGALLITTLDFVVRSGRGAEQTKDIFPVEVSSEIHPKKNSRKMKLLKYDLWKVWKVQSLC